MTTYYFNISGALIKYVLGINMAQGEVVTNTKLTVYATGLRNFKHIYYCICMSASTSFSQLLNIFYLKIYL